MPQALSRFCRVHQPIQTFLTPSDPQKYDWEVTSLQTVHITNLPGLEYLACHSSPMKDLSIPQRRPSSRDMAVGSLRALQILLSNLRSTYLDVVERPARREMVPALRPPQASPAILSDYDVNRHTSPLSY